MPATPPDSAATKLRAVVAKRAKGKAATADGAPAPRRTSLKSRSRAKAVIDFIQKYVIVPEGMLVGKPMVLLSQQKDFIQDVYGRERPDGTLITRRGILSTPRKNGKTGLIAALVEAHVVGPEAKTNSQVYSAARSRDQASQVFNYASKSIKMSPQLQQLTHVAPSAKELTGLARNVMYKALSAEATTAHGKSPALTIHDELGQVVGEKDSLYDALETAGGAQLEPLSLIISTQAPSDTDLLSILIDDALRSGDETTVCHLYAADKDDDIFDPKVWAKANFALGAFRSLKDLKDIADRAHRMPSSESTFRNLYLNMRTARESLYIPPLVWKKCNGMPNEEAFFKYPVNLGLDLSARTDLTAAVASCVDDAGIVHIKVFAFTPSYGLEERARVDRVNYPLWVQQNYLFTTPGRVIDYEVAVNMLKEKMEGMDIEAVAFDRWRMDLFKKEADKVGFAPDARWVSVGQGFRDMAPRLDKFEELLIEELLRHGGHPVLNMAVGSAVAVKDAANNRKLEKARSSARIDALVAAVMSVNAIFGEGGDEEEAINVTEDSLLFLG